MTVKTMAWIWDHSQASGATKLVQLALANSGGYGDDPSAVLLPGRMMLHAQLAQACRMAVPEITAALVALERLGEIELSRVAQSTLCVFTAMRADLAGSAVAP